MNIGGSKIIKKSANLVMQYIRKDAERILITYLIDLRRGKFFFHSGDQSRKSRIILHFQTTLNSVKIRSDGNGIDSGNIGDVPHMMDDLFICRKIAAFFKKERTEVTAADTTSFRKRHELTIRQVTSVIAE